FQRLHYFLYRLVEPVLLRHNIVRPDGFGSIAIGSVSQSSLERVSVCQRKGSSWLELRVDRLSTLIPAVEINFVVIQEITDTYCNPMVPGDTKILVNIQVQAVMRLCVNIRNRTNPDNGETLTLNIVRHISIEITFTRRIIKVDVYQIR